MGWPAGAGMASWWDHSRHPGRTSSATQASHWWACLEPLRLIRKTTSEAGMTVNLVLPPNLWDLASRALRQCLEMTLLGFVRPSCWMTSAASYHHSSSSLKALKTKLEW